jgi:hypothetical protein
MTTNVLTEEQARFAMMQFTRWLALKEKHEPSHRTGGGLRWKPHELTQINADVVHSALLHRLLRGREPLPEPPTLRHAYPVYPDFPYDEDT